VIIGPIFTRELVTSPRRPRHYLQRSLYVAALLIVMGTAWLIVAGTQEIRSIGDMAQFGALLFRILAPLQLALMGFFAALVSASAISLEKDRRTLILLLLTRLTNSELVLGKLCASLLEIAAMVTAGLPVFFLITLFGGVSVDQVLRVFGVTLATAVVTGSLGTVVALWREKTFQTLALTALIAVLWLGVWQVIQTGIVFRQLIGVPATDWAALFSPLQALSLAASPTIGVRTLDFGIDATWGFLAAACVGACALNGLAILKVRVWNPSREVFGGHKVEESETESEHRPFSEIPLASAAEQARQGHVDARIRSGNRPTRHAWDNPVLWREVCTWAYGRKVVLIRFAYLLMVLGAVLIVHRAVHSDRRIGGNETGVAVPEATLGMAPLVLVSLLIVNALAVTSITNERDGQSLEILLVTDLSPAEFVFGKLLGVAYVTMLMIAAPLAICAYLFAAGMVSLEGLILLMLGLVVLFCFATMLGIHCGMSYYNSRTAVGISLGTLFFLFLGIATCIVIMVSFSGSFQTQLIAFSLVNLGGGIGLYVALDHRNRSNAILLAAITLPFWTFFAITSFLLKNYLTMFLVGGGIFGFTTIAMLVPAIHEFDIAMGRSRLGAEDG
jgi:ABC-type transport system involved in multi-copper enzyme maturation permease subunit